MNKTNKLSKIEIKRKNKNLKQLVIAMIILDILALFNLGLQIYLKDITYSSYVVLVICNIVVFGTYKTNKDH